MGSEMISSLTKLSVITFRKFQLILESETSKKSLRQKALDKPGVHEAWVEREHFLFVKNSKHVHAKQVEAKPGQIFLICLLSTYLNFFTRSL